MRPFHFGSADRRLYGVYHAPSGPPNGRAALLLNPWGWEALRAHRSLTTLAERLARSGCAAFRFDYSGTGDSSGDTPRWDEWLDDIEWAIDEVMALSATPKVTLIGLRLGGLLAAVAADRHRDLVERVVLWEAPVDGSTALDWIDRAPSTEAVAFPVSADLETNVRRHGLSSLQGYPGEVMALSRGVADPLLEAVSGSRMSTEGHPSCWIEDRHFGAGRVPTELILHVVDWVSA